MGSFSNYLELEVLDHILGGGDYSRPATVYIGLWTAALSDTSTGSSANEVSGGSYARKSVTNNSTNWPAAAAGAKANGTAITFVTATGSWGTVTYFAVLDAATAGNILGWGALTQSKTIGSGDTASFAVGDLDVTLN
ncbi:hypothetical protein KAW18_18575 [candidate division WOR-3 bacterium]|nr:hypothetical protein [candidate division WOR-3 bacterium]